MLPHPREEGRVVRPREPVGDGRVLPHRGASEVGGVEIAEAVGREIAEDAHAPVDVLEAAFGVVLHGESEEGLEAAVPLGGDIGEGELAGEDGAFQLEAEEDVQVVGDLVGLDADVAALGLVHRGVEVVGSEGGEMGK